jgi:hypothetical protein
LLLVNHQIVERNLRFSVKDGAFFFECALIQLDARHL